MVNLFFSVQNYVLVLPKGIQIFEYPIPSCIFFLLSFILFVFFLSHFLISYTIIFFVFYFVATNTPNTCTALLLTVGCSL